MVEVTERDWVIVKTTLPVSPFPPCEARLAVKTERLLLRPFTEADVEELHQLRIQPEVMQWTTRGTPDGHILDTQENLELRLAPNDAKNYDFAICLAETGQLVGIGGCMHLDGELGWPDIGYMLRKETWGKGFGTEFVRGFLKLWWELPRVEAEVKVDRSTIDEAEMEKGLAKERLLAVTVPHNASSQNVLRKAGLKLVKRWIEDDTHAPHDKIELRGFTAERPQEADDAK